MLYIYYRHYAFIINASLDKTTKVRKGIPKNRAKASSQSCSFRAWKGLRHICLFSCSSLRCFIASAHTCKLHIDLHTPGRAPVQRVAGQSVGSSAVDRGREEHRRDVGLRAGLHPFSLFILSLWIVTSRPLALTVPTFMRSY